MAAKATQRGMTLIELVMFIVIVSVGVAGVLSSLNMSAKASADPFQPKQALVIAEGLLEEVMLKSYAPPADPAPCTPALPYSRECFNDIADFSNYGSGVTGIRRILGGDPIPGLENYSVLITLAADTLCNDASKITVRVTQPDGNTLSLAGYRCNY